MERLAAMEPTEQELAEDTKDLRKQERFKLVEAARALLNQQPTNPQLRAILAKDGRVPVTKNTVELESGVDRRRFSGGDRHREISDLLKELKPDFGVGRTADERMRRQARTIVLLQQQLTASRSATAAQTARIDALLLKLKRAEDRIRRIKAGADDDEG